MQLSILAKLNEDAIQILEQILPYFQPAFNLTIDLVDVIGEKRDMPITLEGIQMEDSYEDDFLTRRALIYTMTFTCKTYLFGPINNSSEGLIKKVKTDYVADTDNTRMASRQVRYTTTPVAVKDYTNDSQVKTSEAFDAIKTEFDVNSAATLRKGDYIQIDEEKMLNSSITGNRVKVKRGQYRSVVKPHDTGVVVNRITIQDTVQMVEGDDFGFGVDAFTSEDGSIYSSSQGQDGDL